LGIASNLKICLDLRQFQFQMPQAQLNTENKSPFSRADFSVLWVLWLTYGSFYFCRTNISAAIPGIQDEFGFSNTETGLILGALKLAYGIGQLVNGQLAERISARKLLTIGMLMSAGLNIVFGMGTALYFLIFIWACNGYFQALGWTPCMRVAANWFPVEKRGRAVGIIGTGYQLTAALTYITAGFSVEWFGWRGAFYVPAILFALCCLHMLIFMKETPLEVRGEAVPQRKNIGTKANAVLLLSLLVVGTAVATLAFSVPILLQYIGRLVENYGSGLITGYILLILLTVLFIGGLLLKKFSKTGNIAYNIWYTLTNPWLWFLAISLALLNACRYGFLDWGLVHLIETQGGSIGKSALKYAVLPLGGIAGALLSGWVTDKWFGGRAAPVIVILLLALGGLTLVYSKAVVPGGSIYTPMILLVMIGFCIYGPQVLLVGTAPMDLARGGTAAAAVGFVNFMGYMGAFSGDSVTPYIVDAQGWEMGLRFWAACAFGAAIVSAFLWNRRSGEKRSDNL